MDEGSQESGPIPPPRSTLAGRITGPERGPWRARARADGRRQGTRDLRREGRSGGGQGCGRGRPSLDEARLAAARGRRAPIAYWSRRWASSGVRPWERASRRRLPRIQGPGRGADTPGRPAWRRAVRLRAAGHPRRRCGRVGGRARVYPLRSGEQRCDAAVSDLRRRPCLAGRPVLDALREKARDSRASSLRSCGSAPGIAEERGGRMAGGRRSPRERRFGPGPRADEDPSSLVDPLGTRSGRTPRGQALQRRRPASSETWRRWEGQTAPRPRVRGNGPIGSILTAQIADSAARRKGTS